MDWVVKASQIDASVNFIAERDDGGSFECRYVQRVPEYFIAYLSSQTGCNQACRFCHLTQMRQTMMGQATLWDYLSQLMRVMMHYDQSPKGASHVNINFMARGEPLLNPHLREMFHFLNARVEHEAGRRGLTHRMNVSSIFPHETADQSLDPFLGAPVTFFWSLYSLKASFRKRWLPKSAGPQQTMDKLIDWQQKSGEEVVIHHALIKGENDDDETLEGIARFIESSRLSARLNLVRYNSFSASTGMEAADEDYQNALKILSSVMRVEGSRIVPRVGRDVAASCGMFLKV